MNLKAKRVNVGLTQIEAAKLLGVGISTLARWEQGKCKVLPKYQERINKIYGIFDDSFILDSKYLKLVVYDDIKKEELVVITNKEVITANSSIIVKLVPSP